ncbi:MAG: hypothetical protein LC754_15470 [Acidobacteria bacterium]|nr:hypothetical protein [Acidobacteriota bacterium]
MVDAGPATPTRVQADTPSVSLMVSELESVYESLSRWCRERDYAGHDPFDALNSRLFQAAPLLRHSSAARLVWTQLFKRSPVNFRALALVPAGKNPKGTALFALAALARFRTHGREEDEGEARALLDELLAARLDTPSGAAWGYNFDWQSRNFYAPAGTPTLVPTAFAARALVEAAQIFGEAKYTDAAHSACDFILRDLPRSAETEDEICFSYIPQKPTRIFNASLLAGETLASVGAITGERELCDFALRAARYVMRRQRVDGSWPYGAEWYQSWVDNFHTAFVLVSLSRITKACGIEDEESARALERGCKFWRESFFLADGWPKYYDDNPYPADIHSAAAAIVALVELRDRDDGALEEARRVARWTITNLRDRRGFFYYQRRRFHTVRTPYIRWAQAWMLYALARLLEEG